MIYTQAVDKEKIRSVKRFLKQTFEMARFNIKVRYRSTFAGFVWVVLNPILMYSAQTIIFKHLLKIELRDYSLFLLTGLLPWIFLVQSLEMSTGIIVARAELLKSFRMNPFVLIVAQVMDNLVNFVTAFLLLIVGGLLYGWTYSEGIIFAPICFLILFLGGCLLSCIFSLLHVFYRDTKYVVSFVLNMLFFLTPIFYPETLVPKNLRWGVDLNPIYTMIAPLRKSLYPGTPNSEIFYLIGKGFVFLIIFYFIFHFLWRRKKNALYSRF